MGTVMVALSGLNPAHYHFQTPTVLSTACLGCCGLSSLETDPCLEGRKRPISLKAAIVADDSGSNMAAGFIDFQAVSATVGIYLATESRTWLASFMRTLNFHGIEYLGQKAEAALALFCVVELAHCLCSWC